MPNCLLVLKRSNEFFGYTSNIFRVHQIEKKIHLKNIQHTKIIYVETICCFFPIPLLLRAFIEIVIVDAFVVPRAGAPLFDQTRNQRELRQLFVGWRNFGNKVVNWWRTWWKFVFYFIFIYFHVFFPLLLLLFKGKRRHMDRLGALALPTFFFSAFPLFSLNFLNSMNKALCSQFLAQF